jgi:hypothetical protein
MNGGGKRNRIISSSRWLFGAPHTTGAMQLGKTSP